METIILPIKRHIISLRWTTSGWYARIQSLSPSKEVLTSYNSYDSINVVAEGLKKLNPRCIVTTQIVSKTEQYIFIETQG